MQVSTVVGLSWETPTPYKGLQERLQIDYQRERDDERVKAKYVKRKGASRQD